jgi:hypothetical protein
VGHVGSISCTTWLQGHRVSAWLEDGDAVANTIRPRHREGRIHRVAGVLPWDSRD